MHRLRRSQIPEWWRVVPLLALVWAFVSGPEGVAYAAEGNLDPTFGTGGKVITDIGVFERPADVATQADGKIVVAAFRFGEGGSTADFILIRYNVDGSLDASFGTNGVAFLDINGRQDLANAVAIQADGKIVVAGTSSVFPEQPQFAVVRVNADGSFDGSFGTGGAVLTPFGVGTRVIDMAIQQDGRIVVVGGASGTNGFPDIALARYNTDGSLDLSFDGDGKVTTDFGGQADATGVAIQADGRIVVSATVVASSTALNFNFALVRYNADGSLDSSFNGDGVAITDIAGGTDVAGAGVVVQSDGKIVVGGTTTGSGTPQDLALVRYNADGSLDTTFGTGGIAVVDLGGTFESGTSLALQVDGKIVLGGTVSGVINGVSVNDAFLVRVDTNGAVDPSFGIDGFATVDFVGRIEQDVSIAIALDGKIVLTAMTPSTIGFPFQDIGVARFEGPTPHALTFFLHGRDVAKTAGGFTMNQTAPERQFLLVNFSDGPAWFSDPAVRGTLLPGGSVRLELACTAALSLPKRVELAATAPDGSNPQVLGEVSLGVRVCVGTETLTIPVTRPVTLANRRLRLTIGSSLNAPVLLRLGNRTFVQADAFIGAP
jgi:uncharacterized delta-60 repeat protein